MTNCQVSSSEAEDDSGPEPEIRDQTTQKVTGDSGAVSPSHSWTTKNVNTFYSFSCVKTRDTEHFR